jgi:hypothetical protein
VTTDRRLDPSLRFNRDRRSPVGDQLTQILLQAPDAVTFDELLGRLGAADVVDVAGWVGHALDRGYIEELSPRPGAPRAFRLVPRNSGLLRQWRRAGDA